MFTVIPLQRQNFMATVNCTNPKTEILKWEIEMQITGMQIDFLFFC